MKDLYPKQLEIAQAAAAMLSDVGYQGEHPNLEIAPRASSASAGNTTSSSRAGRTSARPPTWYFGQWFTKAGAEKLTRFSIRGSSSSSPRAACRSKVRQQKYEEIEKILWRRSRDLAVLQASRSTRSVTSCALRGRRDYYVLLHEVGIA